MAWWGWVLLMLAQTVGFLALFVIQRNTSSPETPAPSTTTTTEPMIPTTTLERMMGQQMALTERLLLGREQTTTEPAGEPLVNPTTDPWEELDKTPLGSGLARHLEAEDVEADQILSRQRQELVQLEHREQELLAEMEAQGVRPEDSLPPPT